MTTVGFIGGFGRSGSTLLERILAQLPEVCALGEVVHLWSRGVERDERCGCGERFSQCPFWLAVGEKAFGGWGTVDVAHVHALAAAVDRTRYIPASVAARSSSTRRAQMREYADYFSRIYSAAASVSGARLVLDSSKNSSTAFALAGTDGIDLRVMHIVRDSRGVAYSWTKEVARPEAGPQSVQPMMDRYVPWRAALLWDAHNLAFTALSRLGTPTLRVRYEDFVAAPETTVRSIADFLGISAETLPEYLSGTTVRLGPTHLVSGNPMRFDTGEVRLRSDAAWLTELPVGPRRMVSSLTWPFMVRYGYFGHGRTRDV
jgi:hypothetical protein